MVASRSRSGRNLALTKSPQRRPSRRLRLRRPCRLRRRRRRWRWTFPLGLTLIHREYQQCQLRHDLHKRSLHDVHFQRLSASAADSESVPAAGRLAERTFACMRRAHLCPESVQGLGGSRADGRTDMFQLGQQGPCTLGKGREMFQPLYEVAPCVCKPCSRCGDVHKRSRTITGLTQLDADQLAAQARAGDDRRVCNLRGPVCTRYPGSTRFL